MRTMIRSSFLAAAVLLAVAVPLAAQKQTPPPAGTPKDFRLPAKRSFTLANGLEVDLVPFGQIPKATIRLVVRAGNAHETANEVWLSDVTADLMKEGTRTRSGAELANLFASMGGSLGIGVTPDQTNVTTEVLTEYGPRALELIAEVVKAPLLPEAELPRIKQNRLRQLAIAKSSPQSQAGEKFASLLYGDHPYGRTYPTEAMLNGYTIQQVRDFWREHFGAARAKLYIAGVFDQGAMEQAVRRAFGDWAAGTPAPQVPPPQMASHKQFALIDRPDAPQSTLQLGVPVPDPTHKDWIALQVTDYLLGGAFGSRITSNIREQKGYTYSPYSMISAHPGAAHWVQSADVTTNVTGASLKEIFAEIDRLQREAPPEGELRGIQNNLAGIFTLQNASRGGVIGRLAFVDLYGLGDAYLANYVRNVLAVTPAEVQRITRTYLDPGKMTLVVVGDRKQIEEQLAPYKPPTP